MFEAIHHEELLEDIKNKFRQYASLVNVFFRFVLLNSPVDKKWYIHFGQVILSKDRLGEQYKEIYNKNGILIVEYSGDRGLFSSFLSNIQVGTPFLMYNLDPQINVHTIFDSCSDSEFLGSNEAKATLIGFPHEKIVLMSPHSVENEINNTLAEYPSLELLILDKLKMNFTIQSILRNRVTFYFEVGLGKIERAIVSEQKLHINLDINDKEPDKYVLKAFIDRYGQTQLIENLPIQKEIEYKLNFIPSRVQILLIYENRRADFVSASIETHFTEEQKEELQYSYDLGDLKKEISKFENQIREIKSKIYTNNIQIGELAEKRLIEAEEKLNTDDILQALSEAMEYMCKDYCDLFEIIPRKVGLEMHDKIVQHWIDKSKKDWTKLLYQTGVRHIIRLGSLKEHNGYKSLQIEVDYLKLVAWRGYYEILRMMKEVQDKNNSL